MKSQIAIILSLAVIAVHCGPVPIAPSVSVIQRHPLIPKCNAGSYICQRTPESTSFLPKCIDFPLVCDGVKVNNKNLNPNLQFLKLYYSKNLGL